MELEEGGPGAATETACPTAGAPTHTLYDIKTVPGAGDMTVNKTKCLFSKT